MAMMQTTFYLLPPDGLAATLFACQLAHKAWCSGFAVHLHADGESACQALDRLLWTWREDSFMPHAIVTPTNTAEPAVPMTIGYQAITPQRPTLLINLTETILDFFSRCHRLGEIIVQRPDTVAIARQKFRDYARQGIKPKTHKVTNATLASAEHTAERG